MEIYDVRGRQVARLVNMRQQVGSYVLAWDGRDGAGEELASGVYFCRLQAGSYVDVRKIILMR